MKKLKNVSEEYCGATAATATIDALIFKNIWIVWMVNGCFT